MRRWAVGTAASMAALAFTAACGSSQPPAFHPGATSAASPAASAGPGTYAGDVHFVYETSLPLGSPQQQLALADRNFWRAYFLAQYTHGKDTSYLSDVVKHPSSGRVNGVTHHSLGLSYGVSQLVSNVEPYQALGKGIKGTIALSNTTVTTGGEAAGQWTVSGCLIQSGLSDTSSSGKVIPNSASKNLYYTDVFTESGGRWLLADWQLADVYPQGEVSQCAS